jgi:predicted HicB family RNase H-like nuclease
MAPRLQDQYTYRISWSPDDEEFVATCAEFPSLSWLATKDEAALRGIKSLVAEVLSDMRRAGEPIPAPIASREFSGEFKVRVTPTTHRMLVLEASEANVSLNRIAQAKLAAPAPVAGHSRRRQHPGAARGDGPRPYPLAAKGSRKP